MWQRTKRLINSHLDNLIERVSSPDRDVREITRGEIARLNELEVQTRASAKLLEKELAEVQLKMVGVTERERMMRERGELAAAETAGRQLVALGAQRDLIRQQLAEANGSAERARALREEHRRAGEELANETHLTAMRENLSGIQSPFSSTDPSATIDEMRGRIKSQRFSTVDARVAEADRELEAERARGRVDEMLARYKQGGVAEQTPTPSPNPAQTDASAPPEPQTDDEAGQSKTLGRSDGPHRPID
ncbi:MAG: hypothetical protein WAU45_01395 [Blastocatellia bacterium]